MSRWAWTSSGLHGEQLIDDYHYMLFPNITLNIGGTSVTYFRSRRIRRT